MKSILVWGMLAGLAAGVLSVLFAHTFGEPQVASAIALEATLHPVAPGGSPRAGEQRGAEHLGLGAGGIIFGIAVGGIFALAFGFIHGRFGRWGPRATSGALGLIGLITVYVVPSLKYPANPPSVGDSATLGRRTVLYFTMLTASVLLAILAALIGRRVAPRFGVANAAVTAAAFYFGTVLLFALSLPGVSEVLAAFPATLLWRFRVAAVGVQVVLWGSVALFFGYLCERGGAQRLRRSPGRTISTG